MNRTKLAASAAIAGLACACATAAAETAAGGTLTDFRIQLIQEVPGGDAPWVTFDGGSSVWAVTTHGDGVVQEGGVDDVASNPAPFGPSAVGVHDRFGGAHAVLAGDVFGAGATASVGSFTSAGADFIDAGGTMLFSGPQDGVSSFTLSPHTTIVISAFADLYATDTPLSQGDFAYVDAFFRMKGTTSQGLQYVSASLSAFAGGAGDGGAFDHESGRLSISLTNPDAAAFVGDFRGFLAFDSQQLAVASVVPEPTMVSAMLAGLGLLAAASRRKERQASL